MTNFSKLLGLTVIVGMIAACGGPQGEKALTSDAQEISVKNGDVLLIANPASSNIEWEGAKPTGRHNGTISLQNGELMLTDGAIIGGKFAT